MKSFLKFLGLFAGILLLSAFFSPILFSFLPFKFERIFRRLVMILTLVALAWAVKTRRLRFPLESVRLSAGWGRLLMVGFGGGVLTLLGLTLIKAGLGLQSWTMADQSAGAWAGRVSLSFLSALLIGVIEESFFRGFIFCYIRDRWKWSLAANLALTNVFYSVVHFLEAKKPFIGPHPDFVDGLRLIAAPLRGFSNWEAILPGAVGLFIFGCILSLLFIRTGSLYPCIGLHAGCVFYLKMMGAFTFHEQVHPLLFGSSKGYDGLLGWGALLLMGVIMLRFVNGRKGILIGLLTGGLLMSSFPGNILRAEDSKKNWVSFEPDAETDDTVVSNLASRSSSPLSPAAQQSKDETHDRVSNVVSAASEVVSSGKSDESVSETPKIMSVTASALKDHDSGQDTPVEDSDIASMLSQVEATLDEKVLQKSSAAMHQGSPSLDVGGKTGAGGDQEIRGATLNAKVSEDILKNQHANPSSPAEAFSRAEASSSVDQTVAPMAPVQRGAAFSEDNSGGIAPQQEPDPSGNETSQLRRRDASPDEGIVKSEKEAFTDMKKPSFVLKAAPAIQPKAASMDNSEVPITPAIKKMVTSPRPSRPVPVYEVVEGEPLNLAKYLAEAEVYNIRDQIEIINGVWRDDGFSFSGEGEAATIKIKQLEFAGKSVSGIYVEPLANTIRRVRFLGVPSGNKLIFQYGIADEGFISNAKSTVYVKIWAGRHVLKRVRVLNEQGWKTEEIDMGVLSFLKEPIVLTFDISADDVTRRYFCFYAEIQ